MEENLNFNNIELEDDIVESISYDSEKKELAMGIKHIVGTYKEGELTQFKYNSILLKFEKVSELNNFRNVTHHDIIGFHKKKQESKLTFQFYFSHGLESDPKYEGKPLEITCKNLRIE